MAKKGVIEKRKRQNFDPMIPVLAAKYQLSSRQIRNIRDGKRTNPVVLNDYQLLQEWFKLGQQKLTPELLNEVKALI
jgi:hypothetical protein